MVGSEGHDGAALEVVGYGGQVRHDERGVLIGCELVDAAQQHDDGLVVRRPRRHSRPQPWLDRNELTDALDATYRAADDTDDQP